MFRCNPQGELPHAEVILQGLWCKGGCTPKPESVRPLIVMNEAEKCTKCRGLPRALWYDDGGWLQPGIHMLDFAHEEKLLRIRIQAFLGFATYQNHADGMRPVECGTFYMRHRNASKLLGKICYPLELPKHLPSEPANLNSIDLQWRIDAIVIPLGWPENTFEIYRKLAPPNVQQTWLLQDTQFTDQVLPVRPLLQETFAPTAFPDGEGYITPFSLPASPSLERSGIPESEIPNLVEITLPEVDLFGFENVTGDDMDLSEFIVTDPTAYEATSHIEEVVTLS